MVYGKFLSTVLRPYRSNVVIQKQQQQKDEAAQGGVQKKKKVTAAQLRVQRGMPEGLGLH
jgi:hypothetical protein